MPKPYSIITETKSQGKMSVKILKRLIGIFQKQTTIPSNPYGPQPKLDLTDLVDALNIERRRYRLEDLKSDPQLTALAQGWADYMARNALMTHGAFGTRLSHIFPNVVGGEDIAEGSMTVAGVVQLWMNSPPHRANILGDFNLVGTGESSYANGIPFWCVDFVKASR